MARFFPSVEYIEEPMIFTSCNQLLLWWTSAGSTEHRSEKLNGGRIIVICLVSASWAPGTVHSGWPLTPSEPCESAAPLPWCSSEVRGVQRKPPPFLARAQPGRLTGACPGALSVGPHSQPVLGMDGALAHRSSSWGRCRSPDPVTTRSSQSSGKLGVEF